MLFVSDCMIEFTTISVNHSTRLHAVTRITIIQSTSVDFSFDDIMHLRIDAVAVDLYLGRLAGAFILSRIKTFI